MTKEEKLKRLTGFSADLHVALLADTYRRDVAAQLDAGQWPFVVVEFYGAVQRRRTVLAVAGDRHSPQSTRANASLAANGPRMFNLIHTLELAMAQTADPATVLRRMRRLVDHFWSEVEVFE